MVSSEWIGRQPATGAFTALTAGDLTTVDEMQFGKATLAIDTAGVFLFLKGTNLTDEDARQHSSPLKDTLPLPGRSLHVGFRWDF